MGGEEEVVVRFSARCVDPARCPFAEPSVEFSLRAGDVVWLRGPSGVGKSTIAGALAGLTTPSQLQRLGLSVRVDWAEKQERCGAVFQQTTLIDSLSLSANVALALETGSTEDAKRLVEAVGLDWARDGTKMPAELSGGMARRGSLALQLAQGKRVVVLDEPFTGLDEHSAMTVARQLSRMKEQGTAFLLVSHQPALAKEMKPTIIVALTPSIITRSQTVASGSNRSINAHRFRVRFLAQLADYLLSSLPLVLLAMCAAGLAISMLSADMLQRIDVKPHVVSILDREVLPLVEGLLAGKDALTKTMTKLVVKNKALGMLDEALPRARSTIYATGLTKLFVLELGPLLTALLLAGRIGGSYAGQVATMQATAQNKLLITLGVSPRRWTLLPSMLAALVAAPFLTAAGTALALAIAKPVATRYGIVLLPFADALVPPLRLHQATFAANLIELLTWPVAHNIVKALTFMSITLGVAELLSRPDDLTHRGVPNVITAVVVSSSLGVIFADWSFSQLLLMRLP